MAEERSIDLLVPARSARAVTRRAALAGLLAAGATTALAACDPAPASTTRSVDRRALQMLTWDDYDDPAVLKAFTRATGTTLQVSTFGSNEELLGRLAATRGTGEYDVVVPTVTYVRRMASAGLLHRLDHDRLPNLKHVRPSCLDTPADPGNAYSVPKAIGATGYVYDTHRISRRLTTWADFFDAARKEGSGRTTMLADPNEVLWAYLLSVGAPLGTGDAAVLAAARRFLVDEVAPHLRAFRSGTSDDIAKSRSVLVQTWNGDARLGILGNRDPGRYRFVKPAEGAVEFHDTWAIAAGAKHLDAAYSFIDSVLTPARSLQELTYIGYDTGITGIRAMAEHAGVERPDLVFYSKAERKRLAVYRVAASQQQRIDIFNAMLGGKR